MAAPTLCQYDIVNSGGVKNVPITKELLVSAASSRNRYQMYLDEERKKKLSEQESRKRKTVMEELEEYKREKKRLKSCADELSSKADALAEQAERKGQLNLITQSNCLRKRSKEKIEDMKKMESKITKLLNALKE